MCNLEVKKRELSDLGTLTLMEDEMLSFCKYHCDQLFKNRQAQCVHVSFLVPPSSHFQMNFLCILPQPHSPKATPGILSWPETPLPFASWLHASCSVTKPPILVHLLYSPTETFLFHQDHRSGNPYFSLWSVALSCLSLLLTQRDSMIYIHILASPSTLVPFSSLWNFS